MSLSSSKATMWHLVPQHAVIDAPAMHNVHMNNEMIQSARKIITNTTSCHKTLDSVEEHLVLELPQNSPVDVVQSKTTSPSSVVPSIRN